MKLVKIGESRRSDARLHSTAAMDNEIEARSVSPFRRDPRVVNYGETYLLAT